MATFKEIERIIERYDGAVSALDGAVQQRIGDSIDAAYRNLERELRRLYPTWQSQGALYAVQRRLLLMEELGDLLQVIRPEMRAEYEQLFTEALQVAHQDGGTMADELIRAREPGYPLQEFTSIPIEAAVLQARDGVERLYRYNDEFKSAVSGVVEQGLIQGWGADKIARTLRGNEQMQGQFGVRQLKSKAETIARTEVMSAFNDASQQRYEQNGIEYFQWMITPSERTCSFCLARHGNVYKVGEARVPAHPRCRCIVLPFNSKWQERGWTDDAAVLASRKEALALLKGEGVKPNYGPTYWEKKAGLEQAPEAVWKPGQKAKVKPPPPPPPPPPIPTVQPPPPPPPPVPASGRAGDPNKPYFDKWAQAWKGAPKQISQIINKFPYAKEIPLDPSSSAYQFKDGIHMGSEPPGFGRGNAVWRHEYGHYIDWRLQQDAIQKLTIQQAEADARGDAVNYKKLEKELRKARAGSGYLTESDESLDAMRKDAEKLLEDKKKSREQRKKDPRTRQELLAAFDKKKLAERANPDLKKVIDRLEFGNDDFSDDEKLLIIAAVEYGDPGGIVGVAEMAMADKYGAYTVMAADLAGSITKNAIGYGHEDAYYKHPSMQAAEAWGNTFSLLGSGDPVEVAISKLLAPRYTGFVVRSVMDALK